MTTTAELMALRERMKNATIDPNGKGPMIRHQRQAMFNTPHDFSIFTPTSGHEPCTALEMHDAAMAAREHIAKLVAAADNMDRIVAEALDAWTASKK